MRRVRRSVFLAGLVSAGLAVGAGGYLVLAATAAPAATAVTVSSPTGTWGTAINVPGTLAADGAEVTGVSCAPGAECTAVGNGLASNGGAFAITEKNGAWGKAAQIPDASKLGQFGGQVTAVSCPASGDCLVAGTTMDQGWYAQEINGHWGNATLIPGLQSLNSSDFLFTLLASCASPGNCAVAGEYDAGSGTNVTGTVFVAGEKSYHWVPAAAVAGVPSAANSLPEITALSCASSGNCVLGGGVVSGGAVSTGGSVREQALGDVRSVRSLLARDSVHPATASGSAMVTVVPFVASEVGGNWQDAVQPSLGLPSTDVALVTSAACPPGGECVVAGVYATSDTASALGGSFLVSQSGTTWSTPATNSTLGIAALACPSAGDCTAAGLDVHGIAAVARENNGTWGSTTDLHGATSLSYKGEKASSSEVNGLACPSAANCSVVGTYTIGNASSLTGTEGFVAGEANGTWSSVTVPASLISLNSGGEAIFGGVGGLGEGGLACASAANCAAGGSYSPANKQGQGAFVLAEVPVRATATTLTRSHSIVTFGDEEVEKLSVAVTSKSGTPGGKVTVKAGATTVCTITLKYGKGSCALSARQFKAGTYHLVANYLGTWPYAKSASSSWPLTVRS